MKRSPEYYRGCYYGYAAARELLGKYGHGFIAHAVHDLEANLRKRSEEHTDFDRGYTHAYRAVVDNPSIPQPRNPSGVSTP